MTVLCARCGVPVRMTSLGCYGHLAPQRLDGAKPHPALVRTSAVEVPPVDRRRPDASGVVSAGEGMSPGGHVLSPFVRRALEGRLPAKEIR